MNGTWLRRTLIGSVTAVGILTTSCGDPARDTAVSALGSESPDVDPGPLHRPGQPCLLCHDGNRGSAQAFTVAGTVFRDSENQLPVGDVEVLLIDSAHQMFSTKTNCAGNFFVTQNDFSPHLPLWASVRRDTSRTDMDSPMHKDGDCNFCHQGKKNPKSAGFIFLEFDPAVASTFPTGCTQ